MPLMTWHMLQMVPPAHLSPCEIPLFLFLIYRYIQGVYLFISFLICCHSPINRSFAERIFSFDGCFQLQWLKAKIQQTDGCVRIVACCVPSRRLNSLIHSRVRSLFRVYLSCLFLGLLPSSNTDPESRLFYNLYKRGGFLLGRARACILAAVLSPSLLRFPLHHPQFLRTHPESSPFSTQLLPRTRRSRSTHPLRY